MNDGVPMFKSLSHAFNDIWETFAAGRYNGRQPHLAHSLAQDAAVHPGHDLAGLSWGAAWMIGSDVVLGVLETAFSMSTMGMAAAAIGVAGAAFYIAEYCHYKHKAEAQIDETNLAGQHVSGSRRDLYKLDAVQDKIVDLYLAFDSASSRQIKGLIADRIQDLKKSVSTEIARVHISDAGTHHAGSAAYAFVQPSWRRV